MRKRLRSTMKWTGTVLTVLLLVVWVESGWWKAGFYLEPTVGLGAGAGGVVIGWGEPWSIIPVDGFWNPPGRHSEPLSWWFDGWRVTGRGGVGYTAVLIPIWVLVVLVATPTLWFWRCDRRTQPGLCLKCGYDLRGNASGVCPECGTPPPQHAPASFGRTQDKEPEEGGGARRDMIG